MNQPQEPGEPHGPSTPSTLLVIPYFDGDRGLPDRPLTGVFYYCPSIVVSGTPSRFEFTPGQPMDVTVDVVNHGAGTSVAATSVVVWWAEPTTGFATLNWFGQEVVAVPSHGAYVARTRPITGTIPAGAPNHLCLLARATALSSSLPPDTTPDPINEPHWAQFNLMAHTVAPGETGFAFSWLAGNPGGTGARYELRVRPADADALGRLTEVLEARPSAMPDMALTIEEGDGPRLAIELDGGEQRRVHLRGDLTQGLEPGTFTAVEVAQFDVTDDPEGVPVGAIGLLLRPGSD
ncbi:hypothetical protein OG810_03565 [Streptomyces sp. NBC_01693]|uniref:hypothetical protein n=1 Tax=unclassified Streptomyces TaxID=2593676 RepID=UPI002E2F9CAD|nr:hypothetical protein [Streptomyces sp. NBC_01693]WSS72616.1 hypothetical protein OG491_31950 [Streptomyces sp. NBC_01175]